MVAAPPAAAAAAALGLHCYGLAVQGVTVDGHPATFELVQPVRWVWRSVCSCSCCPARPMPPLMPAARFAATQLWSTTPPPATRREELPQSVTGAAYESPQRQVTAVAEAAYYLYERQLQRERQPELSIRLPAAVQQQLQQQGAAAGPAARDKGSGGSGGSEDSELRVRVTFSGGAAAAAGPAVGLCFWQQYAATDAQVRRTSGWLPCVDSPAAAVQWEGLELTVRADEVGAGTVVGAGFVIIQTCLKPSRRVVRGWFDHIRHCCIAFE